jgi:hypothetical protein
MERGKILEATRKMDRTTKTQAFAEEVERLKIEFPEMDTTEEDPWKRAAKNVRRLLKAQYPSVSFSVARKDEFLVARWTDGPYSQAVWKIMEPFLEGRFDAYADRYDPTVTPWNQLFGAVKYIRCTHDLSESLIQELTNHLWRILADNLEGIKKPSPKDAMADYTLVPNLNFPICEGIEELAAGFDATTHRYERVDRISRTYFLNEEALKLNP